MTIIVLLLIPTAETIASSSQRKLIGADLSPLPLAGEEQKHAFAGEGLLSSASPPTVAEGPEKGGRSSSKPSPASGRRFKGCWYKVAKYIHHDRFSAYKPVHRR
jgi:hypothetical protein